MSNKGLHVASCLLLVVGGLNWGLVGLFSFDLVATVLGFSDLLVRLVYILVGLSAVYLLATHRTDCMHCKSSKAVTGVSSRPAV